MQNISTTKSKVNRMVGMAIFVAIVVVLQIVGNFIKVGTFSISLVLVPIVIGAAIYGATAGAVLGGAFGVVVLINCINGTDIGGNMLWLANPAITAVLCLLKGILAGFVAGIVYSAVSKKNVYIGVICAAVICPVVNTGIFITAMIFLFRDTLTLWAGDSNILYYAFIGMAGINFLLEMGVNIVLSPVIIRIVNAVKTVTAKT